MPADDPYSISNPRKGPMNEPLGQAAAKLQSGNSIEHANRSLQTVTAPPITQTMLTFGL